jgi:hypothetical protein
VFAEAVVGLEGDKPRQFMNATAAIGLFFWFSIYVNY